MKTLKQINDRAALAVTPVALVLAQIKINPDKSKAPGAKGLEEVVNGFAWYALIAAAAGFLIGGACWAIGGGGGQDHTPPRGQGGGGRFHRGPVLLRAPPAGPYLSPHTGGAGPHRAWAPP